MANNKTFRFLRSAFRLEQSILLKYRPARKRLLIYLVFVLLAGFFWFYRALDDTYVDDIKYPVKFHNLPKNKILTSSLPEKITLRVRGDGYAILNKKFKAPELNFDVNDFSLHSQSLDSLSVYLITSKARESLSQQLISENEELEIISISPDSIFFNFAKTKNKKVPVRLDFKNSNIFAQQHAINGEIYSLPDSVFITGHAKIVDAISYIPTQTLGFQNIKDTINTTVSLIHVQGIKTETNKIKILIPVDKFTESGFNLPISIRGVPDSLSVKVFPRTVDVSYKVTRSRYNQVSETDFRPYVLYSDITNKTGNRGGTRLNVYLDSLPEITFSAKVSPTSVEYLIESKNVEDRVNGRNW